MPILFVNGKKRGIKVRGRARVNPAAGLAMPRSGYPARARAKSVKRQLPSDIFWKMRKGKRKYVRRHGKWLDTKPAKSGLRARRSAATMAKKRKGRKGKEPAGLRRYRLARKRAGKVGRYGKTIAGKRSTSARRRAALKGLRRKARRASAAPKRRRARKVSAAPKRRRRRGRARSSTRSHNRRVRRLYSKPGPATLSRRRELTMMYPHLAKTVKNPARKRRRSRRRHGRARRVVRRHRRRSRRASYRRYRRSYRRNPGNMLMDLAKRAVPLLLAFYGSKVVVRQLSPMIPGLSSLGTLAGPLASVGVLFGANFATKKVSALAKHKSEIMLGAAGAVFESLIQAFAPASVKAMVGMSDYIQMGDYVAVGAVQPINDSMTLSDYIAVGGDGVEEELGLEEELGVEEELGNDLLGGVTSTSLMKRVPTQQFLEPVPARSFTKVIPPAGSSYDNPGQIYGGIFGGGFGR